MKKAVIDHLEELRSRLIAVIIVFAVFFVLGFFFSPALVGKMASILKAEGISLVALTPLEFIYVQLKAGALLSLVFVTPVAFYEAIAFLKPALRKNEKRLLWLVLPFFSLLFITGVFFSYFLLKTGIRFLASMPLSYGISNFWSVDKFVSFAFITSLSCGLLFQIPLLIVGLNKLGIISKESLRGKRKYFYISAFIIAAVITPSVDALTQVFLAVPMILLYELSLLLLFFF